MISVSGSRVANPCRNQQLLAILETQLRAEPSPEGGASGPDVHGDVKEPPLAAAHQLGLCMRQGLKMQASHGTHGGGQVMVVLHEIKLNPVLGQKALVPAFGKETPSVTKAERGQNLQSRKPRFFNLHR